MPTSPEPREANYGVKGLLARSTERRCSVPEPEEAVDACRELLAHADAMDELLRQVVMDFGPPNDFDPADCACSSCRSSRYLKDGGIDA